MQIKLENHAICREFMISYEKVVVNNREGFEEFFTYGV
jgi:hypothetical protein